MSDAFWQAFFGCMTAIVPVVFIQIVGLVKQGKATAKSAERGESIKASIAAVDEKVEVMKQASGFDPLRTNIMGK